MNRTNEQEILEKYRNGLCSDAELDQLHAWYNDWHKEDRILLSAAELDRAEGLMRNHLDERLEFEVAKTSTGQVRVKSSQLWPRVTILAAAIATIVFGVWFFTAERNSEITYANDVAPGKNTATLTLPNGDTIKLSETKTGVVIDASALTYADGSAVTTSQVQGSLTPSSTQTMTVQTPRGGTYQVILPDGTKVWLNAASSITFPVGFTGKNRTVTASGEIYFEVYRDPSRPFVVASAEQELEVLGTHFNINSYPDDSGVKTTLLEGAVRVSRLGSSSPSTSDHPHNEVVLKPGQQSTFNKNGIQVKTVDIEDIVAWKEGDFRFVDQSVTDIMKHIARWYNVEVVYEDNVTDIRLNASISRNRNVSQVLRMMEKTNEVHFKIEGRRIIVRR